ncbi:MAG: dephospho-CoA kinase [Alphaproteobacteria bacterium]
MIVIGLTGSIAMGKSTAAAALERLGVPVHDADAEVHTLLKPGSEAYPALIAAFPYFSYPFIYTRSKQGGAGIIDRGALGRLAFSKDKEREKLESVLHPYVRAAQSRFVRAEEKAGRALVALDIPLLFETGADSRVDVTITVTAPSFLQEARAMKRPGMSVSKLTAILRRQMPDGEKRARADYIVHSGLGRAYMVKELKAIVKELERHA